MRLDRTGTLAYAGILNRKGRLDSRGRVPVLMYHSVSDDDERGVQAYFRLATSPARFQDQMRLLADSGFASIGLEKAIEPTSPDTPNGRHVVITFDDGYVDFLTNAWPALEACSFTATVFLPTAFIGETERKRFKGRECLTWAEVHDLSRRGVRFGSHTVSHSVLNTLSWPQVRSELSESREQIERVVGAPVTAFAYPFAFPQQDGAFLSRFCGELREQGYRANVTTVIGRFAPGDDPFQIKRLPVNDTDDPRLFAAKLAGAYDWVGALQSAWKRLP